MGSEQQRLRQANARLREAICDLNRRQEILEEFIDLQHAEDFQLFLKNRERMMFALEYDSTDIDMANGTRNQKSAELIRLLRVVKQYRQAQPTSLKRKRGQTLQPVELQPFRIFICLDTGLIQRRPPKRCERCYDPGHVNRDCPYKYAPSRTPEVMEMIKERKNEIKRVEINDPFLSKTYKMRHFKYNPEAKQKKKEKAKAKELARQTQ